MTEVKEAGKDIEEFLKQKLEKSGTEGFVVGVSGGIDSAVTASIAVEAVGKQNVEGLVMPGTPSREENTRDALELCRELGIEHREIDIESAVSGIDDIFPGEVSDHSTGNIRARVRMTLLYLEANENNLMVLGTGNRSEYLLGYFTKHGDGAADLAPIVDLYKTEVRELARELDVPEKFIEKEPTAGLWEGQSDEDELGASYDLIDRILKRLVDEGMEETQISQETNIGEDLVKEIAEMQRNSDHKRSGPEKPDIK